MHVSLSHLGQADPTITSVAMQYCTVYAVVSGVASQRIFIAVSGYLQT